MDCAKVYLKLSEYVDGQVESNQAALIRSHLDCCTECQQAFDDQKEIQGDLADAYPEVEAPETLWAGLEARIQADLEAKEVLKHSFWQRLLRGIPAIRYAALPTVIVVFIALYSSSLPSAGLQGLSSNASLLRLQETIEEETLAYEQEIWLEEMEDAANEASRELRWQMMDQMLYDYMRDLRHQAFDAEWGSLTDSKG